MNAPLNVLAVMEDAARRIYVSAETQDDNDASAALLQSCAAVAELIEAGVDLFGPRHGFGGLPVLDPRTDRFANALARAGSAK